MNKKAIELKGILRATSAQTPGSGALEELINMRNEYNSLKPVGKKAIVMGFTSFDKILEHGGTGFTNYIAQIGAVTYRVNPTGLILQTIHTSITANVLLSCVGDMLVINCTDDTMLRIYRFSGTAYVLLFAGLPPAVSSSVTKTDYTSDSTYVKIETLPEELALVKQQMIACIQEARLKDKTRTEGYILISVNYTLFDGSETKMSPPYLYYLGGFDATPFVLDDSYSYFKASLSTSSAKIVIERPEGLSAYKDIIKSINIYVSSPISKFDLDAQNVEVAIVMDNIIPSSSTVGERTINTELFENILLYKQHSFTVEGNEDEYEVTFDAIETGQTMPVDSTGWINTVGRPFIYNRRLHLFDYKKTILSEDLIFELMSSSGVIISTTPEPTTEPPATTPSGGTILAYEYYGYNEASRQAAYNSGAPSFSLMGVIYKLANGIYCMSEQGGTAPFGFYLIYPSSSWDSSESVYIYVDYEGHGTIYYGSSQQTTQAPTTTHEPTTQGPTTLGYLAYDPDHEESPLVVAATVSNWSASPLLLYSAGDDVWYMDDEMTTLATGLFIANYSTTQYIWYEIVNGVIINQGEGNKSGLATTEGPTTTSPGTTGGGMTTNSPTTQPATTESPSTTEEALQNYEYYGYSSSSALAAWESGSGGDIYLNTVTSRFYKLQDGSQLADDGYYITEWADTFAGCGWMRLASGYIVETN